MRNQTRPPLLWKADRQASPPGKPAKQLEKLLNAWLKDIPDNLSSDENEPAMVVDTRCEVLPVLPDVAFEVNILTKKTSTDDTLRTQLVGYLTKECAQQFRLLMELRTDIDCPVRFTNRLFVLLSENGWLPGRLNAESFFIPKASGPMSKNGKIRLKELYADDMYRLYHNDFPVILCPPGMHDQSMLDYILQEFTGIAGVIPECHTTNLIRSMITAQTDTDNFLVRPCNSANLQGVLINQPLESAIDQLRDIICTNTRTFDIIVPSLDDLKYDMDKNQSISELRRTVNRLSHENERLQKQIRQSVPEKQIPEKPDMPDNTFAQTMDHTDELYRLEQKNQALSEELTQLKTELFQKNSRIESLQDTLARQKSQATSAGVLQIDLSLEAEPDETKHLILDIINQYLQNLPESKTRSAVLLQNVLDQNEFSDARQKKIQRIKEIEASCDGKPAEIIRMLQDENFTVTRKNGHYTLTYGPQNITVTLPSSPSDYRTMKNVISDIIRTLL